MVRSLLVGLLVSAVACGVEIGDPPDVAGGGKTDDGTGMTPNGGGPDGGTSTALTPTAFLTRIGRQYCDECFRCRLTYPTGASGFAADFGATVQECYADLDMFYMPALVEQSITAGRVIFFEPAATACLAGITYQSSCATFWQNDPVFPASCAAALVGLVTDGNTCVSNFDCASISSRCNPTTKQCGP